MSVEKSHSRVRMEPLVESESCHQIWQVGNDKDLLSYREQVLRWAGWSVISQQPKQASSSSCEKGVALCIACHTLTPTERTALVHLVRKNCPATRLLAIIAGGMRDIDVSGFDGLVENLEGPVALIGKVRQQLSLSSL